MRRPELTANLRVSQYNVRKSMSGKHFINNSELAKNESLGITLNQLNYKKDIYLEIVFHSDKTRPLHCKLSKVKYTQDIHNSRGIYLYTQALSLLNLALGKNIIKNCKSGTSIYLSRLVHAIKYPEISLFKKEVHHKDKNTQNNNIENLQVLNSVSHDIFHSLEKTRGNKEILGKVSLCVHNKPAPYSQYVYKSLTLKSEGLILYEKEGELFSREKKLKEVKATFYSYGEFLNNNSVENRNKIRISRVIKRLGMSKQDINKINLLSKTSITAILEELELLGKIVARVKGGEYGKEGYLLEPKYDYSIADYLGLKPTQGIRGAIRGRVGDYLKSRGFEARIPLLWVKNTIALAFDTDNYHIVKLPEKIEKAFQEG